MWCALVEEMSVRLGSVSPDVGAVYAHDWCVMFEHDAWDVMFTFCLRYVFGLAWCCMFGNFANMVRCFENSRAHFEKWIIQLGSVLPVSALVVYWFRVWWFGFVVCGVVSVWVWLRVGVLITILVLHVGNCTKPMRMFENAWEFFETQTSPVGQCV